MRARPEPSRRSGRVSAKRTAIAGLTFACVLLGVWVGRFALDRGEGRLSRSGVFKEISQRWHDVPQITTKELARQLAHSDDQGPPVLIDVRESAEYKVSHLPGALNGGSPAEVLALVRDLPSNRPVVLYCSVGMRSSQAAAALMDSGHTHTFNLEGSIFKWANEGHPLVSNGQPTLAVHPYNEEWAVLLEESRRWEQDR